MALSGTAASRARGLPKTDMAAKSIRGDSSKLRIGDD
jgi:hypothetical protein